MITPHGGELVDRRVGADEWRERLDSAAGTLKLTPGDAINLYNLASGGYSPLRGFMTQAEYRSVLASCRLPSGPAWTVPILLQAEEASVRPLVTGSSVVLLDPSGEPAAVLEVESVFKLEREAHETGVFGTTSASHPGVVASRAKPDWCVGGTITAPPSRAAAGRHALDPKALRARLKATGRKSFTAFSTRNIGHIGHEHLHRLALERTDLLGILVITGAQVKGSMLPEVIYDAYERLIEAHYPAGRVLLNELRLPPIYAGPKEAYLQAILVQNHGFTHFIVGRDHAGCGDFYSRYASQRIFKDLGGLALEIMAIPEPRWCKACAKVTVEGSCPHDGNDVAALNGRDVRRLLVEGRDAELKGLLSADVLELLTSRLKSSRPLFFD